MEKNWRNTNKISGKNSTYSGYASLDKTLNQKQSLIRLHCQAVPKATLECNRKIYVCGKTKVGSICTTACYTPLKLS